MDSICIKLYFCPPCVGLISQELLQVVLCNSNELLKKKTNPLHNKTKPDNKTDLTLSYSEDWVPFKLAHSLYVLFVWH